MSELRTLASTDSAICTDFEDSPQKNPDKKPSFALSFISALCLHSLIATTVQSAFADLCEVDSLVNNAAK